MGYLWVYIKLLSLLSLSHGSNKSVRYLLWVLLMVVVSICFPWRNLFFCFFVASAQSLLEKVFLEYANYLMTLENRKAYGFYCQRAADKSDNIIRDLEWINWTQEQYKDRMDSVRGSKPERKVHRSPCFCLEWWPWFDPKRSEEYDVNPSGKSVSSLSLWLLGVIRYCSTT